MAAHAALYVEASLGSYEEVVTTLTPAAAELACIPLALLFAKSSLEWSTAMFVQPYVLIILGSTWT